MDTSLTAALGLGILLGLRHALDADHVAAVSALLTRHAGVARACLFGTFWGAGHTAALLAAGAATIAFRLTISPDLEAGLERVVGLMLIGLGGHVLLQTLGGLVLHRHPHSHGGGLHRHVHLHVEAEGRHDHAHFLRLGRRPFLVGLLHGMAGSAALTLLVLTTIPSALGGILYILVFGIGSTLGMLVLSGLVGIPFALTAGRSPRLHAGAQALAGGTSLLIGLGMLWQLGLG